MNDMDSMNVSRFKAFEQATKVARKSDCGAYGGKGKKWFEAFSNFAIERNNNRLIHA